MVAVSLSFDSTDELPGVEEFERIQARYWVLAFKGERTRNKWLMSTGRPTDVPNGSMIWRRPSCHVVPLLPPPGGVVICRDCRQLQAEPQ